MWTREIEELMRRGSIPGLAIAVVHGGKIVWNQAFGQKNSIPDEQTDGPVHEDTLFPAASLSKPVFAYIALRLTERGVLELDKPLYEYLPNPRLEHDERYKSITGRMALSHSCGLPNWGGTPLQLRFTPGEGFGYSGEGFMYLQAVVEQITGQSLETLAQTEVFKPLQMPRSTFSWSPGLTGNIVSGHRGGVEPQTVNDPKAASAYSLLTTSEEYARFVIACMEGAGLETSTTEAMFTPQVEAKKEGAPPGVFWGLGWGLEISDSGSHFWHWGDNGGFKCFILGYRPKREAIVYFTNTHEGLSIARDVIGLFSDRQHPSLAWLGYDQHDAPQTIARKELAQVFEEQGDEQGRLRYRELRQRMPEILNEKFTNSFGYYLRGRDKMDAAILIFQENAQNYPESANVHDSLSRAYLAAGQVEAAIESMLQARTLASDPTDSDTSLTWMREYQQRSSTAALPIENGECYTGRYGIYHITFQEGNLWYENTERKISYRLLPLTEDTFLMDGDATWRLRFLREADSINKIVHSHIDGWQYDTASDSC